MNEILNDTVFRLSQYHHELGYEAARLPKGRLTLIQAAKVNLSDQSLLIIDYINRTLILCNVTRFT